VERVLPSDEIKKRIADLAVGLAANCDQPEGDVEKIMREHLAGAQMLPFVAFVTYDGKWVGGYSGFKQPADFLRVLEAAEKSPLLQASEAVRKKLQPLVERSEKSAEAGNWKGVVRNVQSARKLHGRCPERTALNGLMDKARAWATGQFDTAIKLAQTGGDLKAALKAISEVRKHFTKEPEADDAALGLKAIRRVEQIRRIEGEGERKTDLRLKAAEKYKDTRWAAAFDVKAPQDE
jgi:hypothetical protein